MDPIERLNDARSAARAGRHAEALNEYVWFHERALEFEPALRGVRLSFALMYWAELAMVYAPARAALRNIRDRKAAAVLSGEGTPEQFEDIVRINEEAFSDRATYDLFLSLRSSYPSLADEYARLALEAMTICGDWQLARRYLPDPSESVRELSERLNGAVDECDLNGESGARASGAYTRNYIKRIRLLLDILRNTGDAEEADRLQILASDLVASPDIREAVRVGLIAADPLWTVAASFGLN